MADNGGPQRGRVGLYLSAIFLVALGLWRVAIRVLEPSMGTLLVFIAVCVVVLVAALYRMRTGDARSRREDVGRSQRD